MRDALNHAAKAMSFLSSKEVTVPAWRKRPDNELVDPTGQEATAWVDVSIRALVQEKMLPLKQIVQYAVQEKRGMFPLKNSQGHRVVSGDFVPFVMTNMGSLDKAAHQFLRKLQRRVGNVQIISWIFLLSSMRSGSLGVSSAVLVISTLQLVSVHHGPGHRSLPP